MIHAPQPHGQPRPRFAVHLHTRGRSVAVRISGEVGIGTSPRLRRVLERAQRHYRIVVLDVSAAVFVDAAGYGVVAQAVRPEDGRGRLLVHDPEGLLGRLFEVLRLDPALRGAGTESIPTVAETAVALPA